MKENIKISVLIPTFQRYKLLVRAIDSVQKQSYSNLLICIYDNASSDDTKTIVEQLKKNDPRIIYYRHEKNIGMIANYTFALQNVSTQYFAFLADDDILYPNCIKLAVDGLEKNQDVAFWGGNTLHVDEFSGKVIRGTACAWIRGGVYSSSEACQRICSGNHMEFQGLVFRTEMIRKANISFDTRISLPDVDFQLKVAAHYSVGISKEVTAVMHSHPQSLSSSREKEITTYWPSLKYIGQNFTSKNNFLPMDIKQYIKTWDHTVILNLLYIAGSSYTSNQNKNIIKILKSDYQKYFLARVGIILVISYSFSNVTKIIGWSLLKLIYAFFRPNIILNRLFPFGI